MIRNEFIFGEGDCQHSMILIPKGKFQMQIPLTQQQLEQDRGSVRRVHINQDFLVGKFPVTIKLYESIMGFQGYFWNEAGDLPAHEMNWRQCISFCNKLSIKESLTPVYYGTKDDITCDWLADGYRLLTDAEWEYVARGCENFVYSGGDNPDEVAWYLQNSFDQLQPVGRKKPNRFGVHDMSGNVWEFCWDWFYDSRIDLPQILIDPKGPSSGKRRISRGGSWLSSLENIQINSRKLMDPYWNAGYHCGLRIAKNS